MHSCKQEDGLNVSRDVCHHFAKDLLVWSCKGCTLKYANIVMPRMFELGAVTCCIGTSDIYVIILQRIYWCMNGAMFHNGYSSATRNMRSNFYNESADKNKTIFWIMRLKHKHNELRHTNCKLHFDCGDFSWRIPAIFTKKIKWYVLALVMKLKKMALSCLKQCYW